LYAIFLHSEKLHCLGSCFERAMRLPSLSKSDFPDWKMYAAADLSGLARPQDCDPNAEVFLAFQAEGDAVTVRAADG
jgi:hypothetical protein